MKNEILATIAQGTLRGTEEEGMMTFYRIPYGTNAGRFHEVGAAPTWEGTRDANLVVSLKAIIFAQQI